MVSRAKGKGELDVLNRLCNTARQSAVGCLSHSWIRVIASQGIGKRAETAGRNTSVHISCDGFEAGRASSESHGRPFAHYCGAVQTTLMEPPDAVDQSLHSGQSVGLSPRPRAGRDAGLGAGNRIKSNILTQRQRYRLIREIVGVVTAATRNRAADPIDYEAVYSGKNLNEIRWQIYDAIADDMRDRGEKIKRRLDDSPS